MADLAKDIGDGGGARQVEKVAAMAARLGVRGDFIRVPQLAKALGISSSSIHAQMRRGNFPVPHRRVGNVIVVKLDDYVRWFDAASGSALDDLPPAGPAPALAPAPQTPLIEVASSPSRSSKLRESKAMFKARIDREVLENMRRKGFDV